MEIDGSQVEVGLGLGLDRMAWSVGQNGLLSFPFTEKERKETKEEVR